MGWPTGGRRDWEAVALWVPVVAVAGLSQAGVGLEEPWMGSDLALAVVSLLLAAPLALRRWRPLATAGVVAAAVPVQDALGGSLGFATFFAVLVSAYAAGRHAQWRATVAGAGLLLAGIVVAMGEALHGQAPELIFPVFYVSAAAVLGAVVRRLTAQAVELRRLNVALARERDATARLAVANERMRLARDLHDVVAHTLTITVVQAEECEEALASDPERARTAARRVQEAGRRGLAELRSMVRLLREGDHPVDEPGLSDLETLAAVLAGAGLEVEVRRSGDLSRVPAEVDRHLFRVAQEALTNVVRHSGARSAVVAVDGSATVIELTVSDPGPALAAGDGGLPPGGHGLAGMGERLAPLGGAVAAGPHDGGGFRVTARVALTCERRPA